MMLPTEWSHHFYNRMSPNRFGPNPYGGRPPSRGNQIQQMIQQFSNNPQALAAKSVGGLSKTLNNVQQVLNVVQSATPIVQQYGPMVKNLPAMYRMMKAFSQIEDDTVGKNSVENDHGSKHEFIDQETINEQEEVHSTRESTPRLYI